MGALRSRGLMQQPRVLPAGVRCSWGCMIPMEDSPGTCCSS